MRDKQSLLNQFFWMRQALIVNDMADLAESVGSIKSWFYAQPDTRANLELMEKSFRYLVMEFSKGEIDIMKLIKDIMGKNYYTTFCQMKPDYGF